MGDVVKDALREQIKEHEGYRLDVYKDTLGFDTGGYGHKIILGEEIPTTKEGWDELFEKDFIRAWNGMEDICAEYSLDIPIKGKCILCEMTFQMGPAGVGKFRNMLLALQNQSYTEAASEMLDSRWAKQTPNRAKKLSSQMEDLAS